MSVNPRHFLGFCDLCVEPRSVAVTSSFPWRPKKWFWLESPNSVVAVIFPFSLRHHSFRLPLKKQQKSLLKEELSMKLHFFAFGTAFKTALDSV